MSNLSGVTNFFSTANEGYSATTTSGILAAATTVPLNNTTGLTDGTVFVGLIEPTGNNQQTFTGTVDITNKQIKNVVWTRGTNVGHPAGSIVVDYVTGTDWNMATQGILKHANQAGNLNPTALYDTNGNKTLELPATTSAVNHLSIDNAATTNMPTLEAVGSDTNIGINFKVKGSDVGTTTGLYYNGTSFRALARDWVRIVFPTTYTTTLAGTWSTTGGTGWTFPSYSPSAIQSDGAATGNEIQYKIYLDAGTYTFTHWYGQNQATGIIGWGVINEAGTRTSILPTTDTYVASGTTQMSTSFAGVNIGSGSYYSLFFNCGSKNAASTAYKVWYFGSQIIRTA